jgi:FKBP-type peptidyl-prolyl cis-trans isomerase FkpA
MKNIFIPFGLIFLISCSTYSEQEITSFDKTIQKFMVKNSIKLTRTDSGLYFKEIKEGKGRSIRYQDSVAITYTGKLLSGKLVDIQKKPLTFSVKDLIMGWKEALTMAKNGSEIVLIIPPNLGYGNHELEQIPQNAILYYDLKVWDVK